MFIFYVNKELTSKKSKNMNFYLNSIPLLSTQTPGDEPKPGQKRMQLSISMCQEMVIVSDEKHMISFTFKLDS